jgi:Arc/MetJ-type ribon-helix-helix transcriptional regulator
MKAVVKCKDCGHTWILEFNKYTGVPTAERVHSKLQAMCMRECPGCGRRLGYPRLRDMLVGREINRLEAEVRDANQTHITVKLPAWIKAKLEEIAGPGDVSEVVRDAVSKFISNTPTIAGVDEEGFVTLSFKVPVHLKREIENKARRLGESISTIVRRALEEMLKEREMRESLTI